MSAAPQSLLDKLQKVHEDFTWNGKTCSQLKINFHN